MLNSLKKTCRQYVDETRNGGRRSGLLDKVDVNFWGDEPLFCPYQIELLTDTSPVSIITKGRQIGFSYSMACRAVLAAISNDKDSIVNSYNRDAIKNFLKDCGDWAKLFNVIYETITYEKVIENQNVNIFELRFNNGRRVIGLPGTPTSFRSFTNCHVVIDEAAYREQPLDDYLAASMATLIHGGTVRIGSTHCGVDNDFNLLIERVKKDNLPYHIHHIPFRRAVNEGLYKRICQKSGEIWTQPKQDVWVDDIYDQYGNRAVEELDGIPLDYSQGGKIFNTFKIYDGRYPSDWEMQRFRYHDLAASEDAEDKNDSVCFSASVRVTYILEKKILIIDDWTAEKVSPIEGDDFIERLSLQDGNKTTQIIEQEPGSTGIKYVAYMQERLSKQGLFLIDGYKPLLQKVKRAIPAAQAMKVGEIVIDPNLRELDMFKKTLYKFSNKPQPLVTDLGDCVSGLYDYITKQYNWL